MLTTVFPFLKWFKRYDAGSFRQDAVAGLTVALVLIPQSMAYAQLAGLPPYYGLYAAFLPPMIAALFGSSRQLATGPVAVVSLMTAASLGPLASSGSEGYIAYAILLALMVGAFQLALGVLRLGLIVNFLSHPVVNGFTNAAALIIATSQLSKMFGVDVDTSAHHYQTVLGTIREALYFTHWPTFFMGALAFAIMYGLKKISVKIPNVLVAVTVTTVLAWAMGFEHNQSVNIAAIESVEAHELIGQFNQALEALPALAAERTRVQKTLDEVQANHQTAEMLKAKHEASIIALAMEERNFEAAQYRAQLRRFIFRVVKQADGSLHFVPKTGAAGQAEDDGRIWHIKAGNKPLKIENLIMIGGGEVVGAIPKGLPAFSVPHIDLKGLLHLLPFAVIISLLGFMEAISIAKAMAARTGARLDPNQELIGQGLANMIGALGKSYPTSGSFSRSAVNLQAGAVSGLSSVFTGLMVVMALLFFTPLLYHLPQSVLAAVIMMAVIGLLNVSGFIHAWKAKWYDGAISVVTFLGTLTFAPHLDRGILIGVVLSLGVFLYKSMRPGIASLSRHEDQSLRNCLTFGLKECENIAMIRFDGPLFFANASYLEDKITEYMQKKVHLRHIIIVSNGINDIDASGEETLSLLVDRIRSAGIEVSMSGVNEKVLKVLRRTHFLEKIGEDHILTTMEKAISAAYTQAHRDGREQTCPLLTVCRI